MVTTSSEHDVQLARIEERLLNLTREHEQFRAQMHTEMIQFRKQTHEWMQQMVDKLPTWAVVVGGLMSTSIGAMAMWIITNK